MPFGINSAPEVFQRKMHEVTKDIPNIHVIVDDILICGKGSTDDEAMKNHDDTLKTLLQRLKDNNIKLNKDKIKFK